VRHRAGHQVLPGATADWYHPDEESAADALAEQAIAPVDFPAVIERAWRDGVRVFIEHGPGAQCAGWIRRILGERDHLAVAMDAAQGNGLWPLSTVVAELEAAGVDVRTDALRLPTRPVSDGPTISIPARLPAPEFPALYTVLERAPDLMLDRITGYWPTGGAAALGRVRAEITVDPGVWFFKAHFFQDPVMPGSLGVEAMCQLLQWYMIERGIGVDLPDARFEPVALNERLAWTYRGQIVPSDSLVTVELEVLEISHRMVFAEAWLWVDGRRIYHLPRFAMRVVSA
jgi:3-hydroxymyristoyl/3-hydroxydecanoyl-(acyl carrier protein) dehydratase